MKIHRLVRAILLLATILFLSACGGSSSQTSSLPPPASIVSGVAATGVPILGTVTLKDRDGLTRGPVATASDGSFSFDVTGLAPPFVLKAEWISGLQTQALFAVATQAGTVHINPLSNLALAFATGGDPASVFGASGAFPDTAAISDTTLTAAVGQMRTLLTPLLNDYGITEFNPLNGTYAATPDNRLDAMLDVIAVRVENGQVTIENRLTGTAVASGSATNPAGIVLDRAQCPDKAALDDVRDVTQRVGALGEAMKLGAALTAAALEVFFVPDPNYGTSSSHTRTQDIASIMALFGPGGSNERGPLKSLRNVRLISDLTPKYTGRGVTKVYLLHYDFVYESGQTVRGNDVTFGKETTSGLWKFIGDPVGEVVGDNYGGYIVTIGHMDGRLEGDADIVQRVGALGEAMKLGAALTPAALEEFFVPDPLYGTSSGHTRTQDIASIVAIFGPGGSNADGPLQSLSNVWILSDLTTQYAGRGVTKAYLLRYDFIFAGGKTVRGNDVTFGKEITSGLWKFIGDPAGETVGNNYGSVDQTVGNNYGLYLTMMPAPSMEIQIWLEEISSGP